MKKYNEFVNESLFTDTIQVDQLFKDMIKDFEDNDKDLRKAKMMNNHMHYVFGKFHQINNSPMTGNKKIGNKDVNVYFFPSESFLESNKGRIEITEIVENPKHDSNYPHDIFKKNDDDFTKEERRDKWRVYDTKEERFSVPYKKAKKIYEYFNNEWDIKYPQLKDAIHKNEMSIREIEKGDDPILGSVDVFDKEHNEIIYPYTVISDKEKLENYIKNHICIQGKSREDYPVTYFLNDDDSKDIALRFMKNTPKERIERINLERVREYSK
jgi:hypothetical protein